MKNLFLFLILVIIPFNSFAQQRVLYIDSCENFLNEDKYYVKRIVVDHPEKKFTYIMSDYYSRGQLLTTGIAKSKNGKVRDGDFVFYYSNGKKMAEGKLVKGEKVGIWSYWDSDENQITKDNLVSNLQPTNFEVEGNSFRGKCLCYFKESVWFDRDLQSMKIIERDFDDGKIIAEGGIYNSPTDTAAYEGGFQEFYRYIGEKLTYPFITRLRGKHGRVFVKFIITKDSEIRDIQFLVSLDKPTENKITKTLLSTNGKWTAAQYKGKKVGSRLILPIIFKFK